MATESVDDLIEELWSIVKKDSLASSRIGSPADYTRDDAERIDELILSIAQQASFIPRGKTISADMFDAKVALLALLREARIDELSWTRQSGRTDLEVVNRINEFGYEQRQHAILKPREK